MQARTIFVWGLTPIILLVAVYLETKDRPKEPLRSWVAPPVVAASASTLSTGPITLKLKIADFNAAHPDPEYQNYWDYEKMWDAKEGDMTEYAFEEWQKTQGGTKVRVEGTVDGIGTTGYLNPARCMLSVDGPSLVGYQGFHHIIECSKVGHLKKGENVVLLCEVSNHSGILNPFIDTCQLQ